MKKFLKIWIGIIIVGYMGLGLAEQFDSSSRSTNQGLDKKTAWKNEVARVRFCVKGQFLRALKINYDRLELYRLQHSGENFYVGIDDPVKKLVLNYTSEVDTQLQAICGTNRRIIRSLAKRFCDEAKKKEGLYKFAQDDLRTSEEIWMALGPRELPVPICTTNKYQFVDGIEDMYSF